MYQRIKFLTFLVLFVCFKIAHAHHTSKVIYTVKKGDSLSVIAKKNRISIFNLKKWNRLSTNKIIAGSKLVIFKRSKKRSHRRKYNYHIVKKGENLSIISRKYKKSIKSLKRLNKLNNDLIFVGQTLKVNSQKNNRSYRRSLSVGSKLGLRNVPSVVKLNSSAVLVVDQMTNETILEKNSNAILPIASVTKLMTAIVVLESSMPLHQRIYITKSDAKLERYNFSRLKIGTSYTRDELLKLSLMSSENRAAHALARTYPGGIQNFVYAMNTKSKLLGMTSTKFTEPTGLNSGNVSSPKDLAILVDEASRIPIIRDYSTYEKLNIKVRNKYQKFKNSNSLIRNESWNLEISKTGFIRPSGNCLVMLANIKNKPFIIILLDAQGNKKRMQDAENIRSWVLEKSSLRNRFSKNKINENLQKKHNKRWLTPLEYSKIFSSNLN